MKRISNLLFVGLLFTVLSLSSCSDNETKVADVIVTSHRSSGKFYVLDKKTGQKTEAFAPKFNGDTLKEIRAFVYHPNKKKIYASVNSYKEQGNIRAGFLYSIDPKTMNATRINNNDGNEGAYAVWDAIVNWAVASDDSLVSVGDFNGDGNGIVKFGTDGGRSLNTVQLDICCGLGLLYDKSAKVLLIGNYPDNNGEVRIDEITESGVAVDSYVFTTFSGFPAGTDFSGSDLYLKAMVKDKKGTIFAIVFNVDSGVSYFVKLDLDNLTVTYLSTLGENYSNQYNSLAIISGSLVK
jgi:hypothetical protein